MSDTTEKPTTKPAKAARQQHVVAHLADSNTDGTGKPRYDDVVVFGQEIDALRHIVGKDGWVYKPLAHGQAFGAQA